MTDFTNISSEDFFDRADGQKFYCHRARPIIVGINLRSPSNLGALIRLAGNFGAEKVIFAGNQVQFKSAKLKQSASNAYEKVSHKFVTLDEWKSEIPADFTICAIETAINSQSVFEVTMPEKIAFVVGDETNGIPDSQLAKCHMSIHIPMFGHTLSMNVSHSLSVVLFQWISRQLG